MRSTHRQIFYIGVALDEPPLKSQPQVNYIYIIIFPVKRVRVSFFAIVRPFDSAGYPPCIRDET